ncbi:MAG: FAD-dependent oxidoreductase [Devosia sp.]
MADTLKPDLCIIGAGALGTSLAIEARARDLSVVLVGAGAEMPGQTAQTALQRAAFVASADRAHAVRSAGTLGLGKADPKPNFRAISERAASIADAAAPAVSPQRLAALGITVLSEPAKFVDQRTLAVGASLIRASRFVLATGSRPLLPELPGLDQVDYFTPDTILANMRKLSHLLVIGGAPAALELAQAYARLGAQVTLVPQGALLADFDPEPVAVLLRCLRDEGITILQGASVTAVLPRSQGIGIAIAHEDGSLATLDVSHILLASGRVPDLDADLLALARLKRDPRRPERLSLSPEGQSSNGHIWAIGGAAGAFDAPHARRQAGLVLQRASGQSSSPINPLRLPRLVNTTPALGQLGLLETGAPLRPGQLVLRASASETAAAHAAGDLVGSAKLIVTEKTGAIVGAAVLGAGTAESIAMLALALERGLGAADLADLLLPPASPAALLVELGQQFRARHKPTPWERRRAALRQLRP